MSGDKGSREVREVDLEDTPMEETLVRKKNKADRYNLPKQSSWFFSSVLAVAILVVVERVVIVIDGVAEKHVAFCLLICDDC